MSTRRAAKARLAAALSALGCFALACGGDTLDDGSALTTNGQCVVARAPCPIEGVDSAKPCDDTTGCGTGFVCEDLRKTSEWTSECSYGGALCWPDCQCAGGDVCTSTGACRPPSCDEPDAPACPDHFRCDPAAAGSEPEDAKGSVVYDPTSILHTLAAGCVRLRCDEPDGYTCDPHYGCSPADSDDATGCVPLPCTETGLCADSYGSVCPTPDSPRADWIIDDFGCVPKGCGDPGYECVPAIEPLSGYYSVAEPQVCDEANPAADRYGCVTPACDAPGGGCPVGFACDPSSDAEKTSTGCRLELCPTEYACTSSQHCDPSSEYADGHGCTTGAPPKPNACTP